MIPFLVVLSLLFPARIAPEIPVTTPSLGRAPGLQDGLRVASNGSITLAAWVDGRSRSIDVFASRVDVTGKPLDPTGIVVREHASLDDVFWDGTDFVVVTTTSAGDHELVFVSVDGAIRKRVSLPIAQNYAAHTYQGADSRLLFLPHDGYSPLATIADLQGNIIKRGGDDTGGTAAWKASNGTGFLVIRHGNGFVAEEMDRDGDVLSSIDPQFPSDFSPAAMSGDGRGGYVLAGYLPAVGDLTLIHLNADGLQQGTPVVLQARNPEFSFGAASATMTNGGFVVTWAGTLPKTLSYVTYVSRDGGGPVESFTSTGYISDLVYDRDADLVFTATRELLPSFGYDVWVQKGTASPQPLTQSATDQSAPQV
ncbi:MAG TPA: hypothetical protein VGJ82_11250, partial [Thermoanaerobaculia bacterium]